MEKMKKAKRSRAPYKCGTGAVDKYVGIIYEIHAQAQKRRATTSITNIATKNNASKLLGSVMKRMGIVKGRFPYYQWTGDTPNRKMARQILDEMKDFQRKPIEKPTAYKPKPKPKPRPKARPKRKMSFFWGLIKIEY